MRDLDFEIVYRQYCKLVMKVARTILRDYNLAQDICQDVFIRFYEKADCLDEKYFKAWLLVNTRRKAIDYYRKSYKKHEKVDSLQEGSSEVKGEYQEEDDVIDRIVHKELTHRLMEDLEKHNKDWYVLVMRIIVENEEPQVVARDLGLSIEGLRTKLHRARTWIRKHYKAEYDQL